jgi:EAL domain-containing protein (putative c-di-GMP-specific phosphodiesterase class I)
VAIETALSWLHPQHGQLPHERCAHAAERTGAVYAIGQWLLQTAAQQAARWQQLVTTVPPVAINLTPSQARDPDLIASITAVLADTGLPPAQLELRAPVAAIRADTGELVGSSSDGGGGGQAEDNLRVLSELGIRAGLHDFAGGIGALRCVADLSPRTVRIATLVSEQVIDGSCPILSQATQTAVQLVRAVGADVIAYPVDTDKHAAYLSSIGANWAAGALFGPPGPPECIEALLTAQAG